MSRTTVHRTSGDNVIALMESAAAANRASAFRSGFLIELPPEGEVFVTGDLHGNQGNLQRIIEVANLPRYRHRYLILQELVHELTGEEDVCRSHRLVELAARLKVMFPGQVYVLLGNHEFSEILDLAIGKEGRELNVAFDTGGHTAYGGRWNEVKDAYQRFWRTSPVAIRTSNGLFISHSTPRLQKMGKLNLDYLRRASPEQVFQRNSPVFNMLWGRDYSVEAADEFARRMRAEVLIVGHTACEDGFRVPNKRHIVLDCKDFDGRYLLLPLDRPLTQPDVLPHTRRLYR